jgi:hypothetical protein
MYVSFGLGNGGFLSSHTSLMAPSIAMRSLLDIPVCQTYPRFFLFPADQPLPTLLRSIRHGTQLFWRGVPVFDRKRPKRANNQMRTGLQQRRY